MSDTSNLVNSIWPNGIKVDSDGYGMFTSLEDAQSQMRLKKIGEEEIETA